MELIFDFDHTLFSAKRLYSAFKEAFLKLGVEENLFQATFEESKGKGRDYKPEKQFKLIHQVKPEIKIGKLKKSFEKVLKTAPKFFYNDTLSFLKKWSKEVDFILLSYGEGKFQKNKIKASKIGKYFKKIIITRDIEKSKPFRKVPLFREKGGIVFVEDNPQALSKTKTSFPQIVTVRINRGEGKYYQKPNNSQIDFSIKNLKELEKILKKMIILKANKKNLKEVIKTATQLIKEGKVIVCPTESVYGLIADAKNKKAVEKIFKIKKRSFQKTISIFVKDLKMAKKFAKIDKSQEKFLKQAWPGKAIAVLKAKTKFPKGIVCRWGKIGQRVPRYKLLNKILSEFKGPIAQTSANIAGKPTPTAIEDILRQFKKGKYKPDMAIDVGRLSGKPSKVIDLTQSPPKILRG